MCEDDENELWRRQIDINDLWGLDMNSLYNLRLVSRVGSNNLIMTFDGMDSGKHTVFFEKLLADIKAFKPDLVILDTAADLFGGNEINRSQVRQFIQNGCGRIARETGGAVLICAHPSDSGIQRKTGSGGSTAWNNTVRSRWYLQGVDEEGADPNERVLSRKKSNYSASGARLNMIWQDGTFKRIYHEPEEKKASEDKLTIKYEMQRDRKRDAIIELIKKEALEGRMYASREFASKFEDVLQLGSFTTIKRLISGCVDKGELGLLESYQIYNLPTLPRFANGYLYIEGMSFKTGKQKQNSETGKMENIVIKISKNSYKKSERME